MVAEPFGVLKLYSVNSLFWMVSKRTHHIPNTHYVFLSEFRTMDIPLWLVVVCFTTRQVVWEKKPGIEFCFNKWNFMNLKWTRVGNWYVLGPQSSSVADFSSRKFWWLGVSQGWRPKKKALRNAGAWIQFCNKNCVSWVVNASVPHVGCLYGKTSLRRHLSINVFMCGMYILSTSNRYYMSQLDLSKEWYMCARSCIKGLLLWCGIVQTHGPAGWGGSTCPS